MPRVCKYSKASITHPATNFDVFSSKNFVFCNCVHTSPPRQHSIKKYKYFRLRYVLYNLQTRRAGDEKRAEQAHGIDKFKDRRNFIRFFYDRCPPTTINNNNNNDQSSAYLTMNGESHDDMISFSLYACSIWPWLATSHFFNIFNANVSFLSYCTNSTRPKPPTPSVPIISKSDNWMWSYSVKQKK